MQAPNKRVIEDGGPPRISLAGSKLKRTPDSLNEPTIDEINAVGQYYPLIECLSPHCPYGGDLTWGRGISFLVNGHPRWTAAHGRFSSAQDNTGQLELFFDFALLQTFEPLKLIPSGDLDWNTIR